MELKKKVSKTNVGESLSLGGSLEMANEVAGEVKHTPKFLYWTIGKWVVIQRQIYRKR